MQEEKTDMLTRKLKKAEAELTKQSEDYKAERKLVRSALGPVPPLDISCPAKFVECEGWWSSEPFYTCIGGDELHLECYFIRYDPHSFALFVVRKSRLQVKSCSEVTIVLVDQDGNQNKTIKTKVINELPESFEFSDFNRARFCKNGHVIFRVSNVQ